MDLTTATNQDTVKYKTNLRPIDTSISYIMGHFNPALDSNFIEIDISYADRKGMWIRKDTYEAFQKMYAAALKEGIKLQIRSATRNFEYQKGIWERKWTGQTPVNNGERLNKSTPDPVQRALKILRYSSMPGTSRHHWGTDIDFNSFNNDYFASGEGKKLYDWLNIHGPEYGFLQPYTPFDNERINGYQEEKWHWSFYPVSKPLTQAALNTMTDSDISGFLGSETAAEISVVQKYILGIHPKLLK